MKHKTILFTGFLLFAFALNSSASVIKDTTASKNVHDVTRIFNEQTLAPYNLWHQRYWTVDTMPANLHQFISQYNLGNTGLPDVPVVFCNNTSPLGFYYANDHLSEYIRSDTSIRYYNTRAPYTSFFYVTDPQIHQMLSLYHSQNFGKKLNVAFEFHRTRSEGLYVNQGTNLNQAAFTANYKSKRYVAFANVMYDVMKIQQNGGIAADSDLNNPQFGDRQTVPTYLTQANTAIWEKSFHLQQYYFFGYKSDDTLHNRPLFYLSHSLRLAGHSNMYSDPEDSTNVRVYNHHYHDTVSNYDSLHYNEFSNDLSIGSGQGMPFLKWEAGVKQQWIHFVDFVGEPVEGSTTILLYSQQFTDTILTNLIAHARVYNTFMKERLYFGAEGEEVFSGNNKGDVKGMAELGVKIDSLRRITLKGNYSSQAPDFIYQLYHGNNFEWRNDSLNRVTTSAASLIYEDAKWHLGFKVEATQITNLMYFNTLALPAQYTPAINILTATFTKEFSFRHWHLNTKEVYQQVPDDVPLPLPQFVAENSIFYQGFLFNRALVLKAGIDVFYNTAYQVYAYMPVYNQFYIQDQQQIGGYVYLNPFVSFRIKTFRMFVKFENVGSGILTQSNSYYAYVLHYPMTDRVLRFGISWDFWN
ncbi:MAG TPA: putative porin [Bacteroidia bacterium]|nr:putative porin [Bacteroidia bacterium]